MNAELPIRPQIASTGLGRRPSVEASGGDRQRQEPPLMLLLGHPQVGRPSDRTDDRHNTLRVYPFQQVGSCPLRPQQTLVA